MTWTTAEDLRAQVERLWDRGELLRALVADGSDGGRSDGGQDQGHGASKGGIARSWPLRLTLKTPSPSDLSDRFDVVREWVRDLERCPQVRFETRKRNDRVLGPQRLPAVAWIDSVHDALMLIERTTDAERFTSQWRRTAAVQPRLLDWVRRRPLVALEHFNRWERLLAVVTWMQLHPRPAIYVRQVEVPGIDSKFIEAHRGVLTELLDAALPAEAIDAGATGGAQFARRYGFLERPARVRFRLLDPTLAAVPGCAGLSDITLDAPSFAAMRLPIERVLITENETNFLALPPIPRTLALFGAGYGWASLTDASWLLRCYLQYWGDIDTHGFAILDQLRAAMPHAQSFLMDDVILHAHREHWGEETTPVRHDLPRLTEQETKVYDDLRYDRIRPNLRLEQERIGFWWVRAALGDPSIPRAKLTRASRSST